MTAKSISMGAYYPRDGKWYVDVLCDLLKNPALSARIFAAVMSATASGEKGWLDEREQPDREAIAEIQKGSQIVAHWLGNLEL